MRPGAEILDEFYGLVEADPTKRYNAVGRLVLKARAESTALDYCIERLITGLSSPRGAARFGYSAALVILLSEFHDSWTVERLFALAAKKLDLNDKESGSANAIGRHLLISAIVQSKAYSKVETELIEKELDIYRSFPVLGMSIVQMIADIASEMEKKRFKSGVFPLIKNYLDTAVTSTNVEFIYLALLLKDKFPSYISESISFIQKDGSCKFSVSDLTFLLLVVKKCDSSALAPFLKLLMVSSRASGQFVDVYRNVVEKWCTTGDESKVLERIFDTAKLTLSTSSAAHEEVLAVFSPFLLKRITQAARGKQTPQYRVVRGKISEFCKFVEELLADLKDDAAIIDVINALD
ncbi:hypothetical protein Q1695_014907 [Nippostrongylus brasiliensis]|nr:hypothetical protein Q1695_014907 [Nippostrongylus brasiliensis]